MEEQELQQQSTPEITETIEQQPQQEQRHTRHFNEMRKKLDAEEEARKAAERRAYELEQKLQQMYPQSPQVAQEEDDLGVDNEEYVQAKHVKTSQKKIRSKMSATEQKIAELEKKLEYFEAKVDTDTLKDFNDVVNDENIKTFARLYPDDYQSMMANPNFKARSRTAYNMIKNYGIVDTTVATRSALDTERKIAVNKQKPQSASLTAPQAPQTPLTRLDEYERRWMTEDERDRILAEVARKKQLW